MAVDFSAIAKWPNVPACYGWLSLDRRGIWRIEGEPVLHAGFAKFLGRQYTSDETGRWFVQNGPQRVFVDLSYTPRIFRREASGFISHTGEPAGNVHALFLDEFGNILLHTTLGIGLLDDRDLAGLLGECDDGQGQAPDEAALLALMHGETARVFWHALPLLPIAAVDVAKRFKFEAQPQP